MSLRINQNITSLSTYSNLNRTSSKLDKSISKLSSGLRINTAADDAAGLAISEKMRSQISGLNRAKLNAQDGVSMIQTAEGGLNETESIIQRMRELAIQASNDTLTSNDRLEIQKEINQLTDAIDDIADSTEFNTKKLLNGSQTAQISSSSSHINGMVTGNGVAGGDFTVSMTVLQGGISQMQTSQMFMDKNSGSLAKGSTKLEDIAQFYDDNGVFALATAQQITVTGNAETTSFTLDGKMTINELAASIQNALTSSSNLGLKHSTARFVESTGTAGMGGYLEITSGVVGDEGNFSFAGDQAVMDALGLSVTRQSSNNLIQAKMKDASGNTRTVTTSTDRASGLLDGIDVQFDSTPAQIAGNGGIVNGLCFTADENIKFSFQYGEAASSVATVDITLGATSTYSMEGIAAVINNKIAADANIKNSGMEATVVDGQIRLSYNPTDTKAPTEIKILANAESIGFTEGTYTGFVDGDKKAENMIQGITSISEVAAQNQIIHVDDGVNTPVDIINLGTTRTANMVTSVNGDLTEIKSFILTVNQQLQAGDVNVRLDAVNGSLCFTSLFVGQKNNSNAAPTESLVHISFEGDVNNKLGFTGEEVTAKGTGDTNFRLHVIDNSSQLQIGANQGQTMSFNIGDMSAAALDIDKLDMSTTEGAQDAIGKLDNALAKVSAERSKLGAFSNRLSYTMNNLENAATNLTDSESRIRDLDMASEMVTFTSAQVMQQAGTAMLAQANSLGQSVLQLLQ